MQQLGQGFRGVLLEIVHQHDALAQLVQLLHHAVDNGLRLAGLEIEGVEIARKNRDVAGAEVGHHFGWVLQRREAEERSERSAGQGPFYRAEALFDLFLALILGQLLVVQIGVRPGM